MPKFIDFHFFYSFLIIFMFWIPGFSYGESDLERKVHIVYMGSIPEGEYLARSHHISLLQSVGHSKIMTEKTLTRSYTRSFNGFSAYLTSKEVAKLKSSEEIFSIFESRQLQIQTTRSWDYMGLTLNIPRNPTVESDIIIGHMDSGLLPELKSFSDHNLGNIPKKWKGVCDGGKNFVCNKKLIGARYYNGNSARDTVGHGTHTASTAVGRIINNANFYGIANGTARGGVPSARIATYKVCGVKLCFADAIMAAFDDAIADRVDIITVSLASIEPVNISEDAISIGSFHAMQKNILTVQGAGNTNINMLKMIVSNAPWLFTVAASTIDRKFINKLVLGNGRTIISNALSPFVTGSHNKRLVYGREITIHCNESNAMKCKFDCIEPHLVKGKIIICDEDVDHSSIALLTAMNANASGIILRESETANSSLSFMTPFPTAVLSRHNFQHILSYFNSIKFSYARILKSESIHNNAPILAFFSKRGPNIIIPEILKPDITAPGVDILAECPIDTLFDNFSSEFNIQSGTSMSCPHVTGAAAYVKSKHLDWSTSAIKSSLMTTAWAMNTKYNVDAELGYGAGHVDPVKAIHPGLVYETFVDDYINMFCSLGSEGDKLRKMFGAKLKCPKRIKTFAKDLNYPTMTAPVHINSAFTIQFRRVVTNVGHANSTYNAQISTGDNAIYMRVEPSVLSFVRLNQRKKFVVTISGQWLHQDHISSSLLWSDGTHKVKSPILLYRSSIL